VNERQTGTVRYAGALRDHWLLIVVLVAIAGAVAAFYSFTAEKRYEAEADVLITPVPGGDDTFVGFSVLRAASDEGRNVLTAARLIGRPAVAEAVAEKLGLDAGYAEMLETIEVKPLAQSGIVALIGKASTPEAAAEIANGFAEAAIDIRTAQFQAELAQAIDRLTEQLSAVPEDERGTPEAESLQAKLTNLLALKGSADPTMTLVSPAVAPSAPSWPKPRLAIPLAILAALLLGAGVAVGLELLNPKINREDELLLVQRLPILARIPRVRERDIRRYLAGRGTLPGEVWEAYRTLRASLANSGADGGFPRTILITSAAPSEGKTFTAVNLAITLALTGMKVILVDGDLRRPMIATVFGVTVPRHGFATLLTGESTARESLSPVKRYGEHLQLLLASPKHASLVDLLDQRRLSDALDDLQLLADVVVVDSPPLTEVADALTLVDVTDVVLVTVRLGSTRRDKLSELRRMLTLRGVSPAGLVVTERRRVRRRHRPGYGYVRAPQLLPHQEPESHEQAAANR
jgi:capsular exopolysaccharide synthesis family protein